MDLPVIDGAEASRLGTPGVEDGEGVILTVGVGEAVTVGDILGVGVTDGLADGEADTEGDTVIFGIGVEEGVDTGVDIGVGEGEGLNMDNTLETSPSLSFFTTITLTDSVKDPQVSLYW